MRQALDRFGTIRKQLDALTLDCGGAASLAIDPLASWREQQSALRDALSALGRWRFDLRIASGLPAFAPRDDRFAALRSKAHGIDEILDDLAREAVGAVIDAASDDLSDDEHLFAATLNWARSQPWNVIHYYLTIWLKALELLTAAATATDAVETGTAPTAPILFVIAAIYCTAEFALLLSRPGGPDDGE